MSLPQNSAKQREHGRARILTLLLADDALTEPARPARGAGRRTSGPDQRADPAGQQPARRRYRRCAGSLPPDERHVLWQQVDADKHGQILVEASETVWDSLISGMSDKELLHALSTLDIDDQISSGQHLPRNLMGRLLTSMAPVDRDKVREVIRYGKHGRRHDGLRSSSRCGPTHPGHRPALSAPARPDPRRTPTSCSSPIGATGCGGAALTAVLLHKPRKPW